MKKKTYERLLLQVVQLNTRRCIMDTSIPSIGLESMEKKEDGETWIIIS